MDSPSSRENLSTSTPSRQRQRAPSSDTTLNHTRDVLAREDADSPVRKKPRLGDSNTEALNMADQSAVSDRPNPPSRPTSLPPAGDSAPPAVISPSKVTLSFRKLRSNAASPSHNSSPEPPARSEMSIGAGNHFKNAQDSPKTKEDVVDGADTSSSDSSTTPVHEIKLDNDGAAREGEENQGEEVQEDEDEDEYEEYAQDANESFFFSGPGDSSAEAEVFDRFPFSIQSGPEDGAKKLCIPFDTGEWRSGFSSFSARTSLVADLEDAAENTVTFKLEHICLLADWLDEWTRTVHSSRRSQHRIYAACGDFWDSIGELFGKLITRKYVVSRPPLHLFLALCASQLTRHVILPGLS